MSGDLRRHIRDIVIGWLAGLAASAAAAGRHCIIPSIRPTSVTSLAVGGCLCSVGIACTNLEGHDLPP